METILINGRSYTCEFYCCFQQDGARVFEDMDADREIIGLVYTVRRDDGVETQVDEFYGGSREDFVKEILREFRGR